MKFQLGGMVKPLIPDNLFSVFNLWNSFNQEHDILSDGI